MTGRRMARSWMVMFGCRDGNIARTYGYGFCWPDLFLSAVASFSSGVHQGRAVLTLPGRERRIYERDWKPDQKAFSGFI